MVAGNALELRTKCFFSDPIKLKELPFKQRRIVEKDEEEEHGRQVT